MRRSMWWAVGLAALVAGCGGSGSQSASTVPAGASQSTSVSLVLRATSASTSDPTVNFQVTVLAGTSQVAATSGSFTTGQSGTATLPVPANELLTVQVSATEGSLQFAGSTTTTALPGTVDSVQIALQQVGGSSSPTPTPTPTPFSPAMTIGNVPGPQGLAFDPNSGVLWAAVTQALMKFDPNGNSLGTFGSGTVAIPIGVAVDSSGNVYEGDYGLHQALKFDANGNFLMSFGSGLGRVTGVAVDSSGTLYVADDDNSQIDVYNAAGVLQRQFSTSIGADGGGLAGSVGIGLDGSGNLWVAEYYYHVAAEFNATTGQLVSQYGTAGSAPALGVFSQPYGLTVTPSGTVLVTDAALNDVQLFTESGTRTGFFASANPSGVAVDRNGLIYVSDRGNNAIHVFNP